MISSQLPAQMFMRFLSVWFIYLHVHFMLVPFNTTLLSFFLRMPCATGISVSLILRNSESTTFRFMHSLFHRRNQLVWFHLICAFYKCGTNLSLHFLQVVYILIALALLIVLVIRQVLKLNLVAYNSSFLNPQLFSSFKL